MKGISLLLCVALAMLEGTAAELTCKTLEPGFRAASIVSPPRGVKNILWTRLAFANETNLPAVYSEIQSALQLANATLARVSNTNVSLIWTVTPVLQLPNPISFYTNRLGDLLTDGRNAAAAAGFNWQSFDIMVFSPRPIPGWPNGSAAVLGQWIYCPTAQAGLIVHELGHSFGLWHANAWQARGPDFSIKTSPPFPSNFQSLPESYPLSSNGIAAPEGVMFPGQSVEYGDPFDIMGNADANSDFNMAEKFHLGWIPAANITTVTNPGTYRLSSQHALRLAPVVVGRFLDKEPRQYWIELAAGGGGVYLRWADTNILRETLFLDATPGSRYSRTPFQDGLLKVGSTFEDAGLGLWITPTAMSGDAANPWIDLMISKTPPANLPTAQVNSDFILTGRVTDSMGKPLAGALIQNGQPSRYFGHASTFSDENGAYALAMIEGGVYAPTVSLYGYRLLAPGPNASVNVPGSLNFVLDALPRVSLAGPTSVVSGASIIITATRTGSVAESLAVDFQMTGDVEAVDLQKLPAKITIPAGQSTAPINVALRTDFSGPKTFTFHVVTPSQFERDGITYSYPGWELRTVDQLTTWFQTDPPYVMLADGATAITVADPNALQLAIAGMDRLNLIGPVGATYEIETSTDFLSWYSAARGIIGESPMAITLPLTGGKERCFYRGRILR